MMFRPLVVRANSILRFVRRHCLPDDFSEGAERLRAGKACAARQADGARHPLSEWTQGNVPSAK